MNRRGFLGMLVAAVTIPFTGLPKGRKGPIVSNGWKGLPPAIPAPALSIPCRMPANVYIRGPRYTVTLHRIIPVTYPGKVTNDCT